MKYKEIQQVIFRGEDGSMKQMWNLNEELGKGYNYGYLDLKAAITIEGVYLQYTDDMNPSYGRRRAHSIFLPLHRIVQINFIPSDLL